MGEPFTEIDAWYSSDPAKPLQFGKLGAKPIEPYDIDGQSSRPLTSHPSSQSSIQLRSLRSFS